MADCQACKKVPATVTTEHKESLCKKCSKKSRCPRCEKRVNRLMLEVGGKRMFCGPCYRKMFGKY